MNLRLTTSTAKHRDGPWVLLRIPELCLFGALVIRINPTWAPKVCKIMAVRAIFRGLGPLFHILFGGSGIDVWDVVGNPVVWTQDSEGRVLGNFMFRMA